MNDRIFEMQVGRVLSARVSPVVNSRREPMYSRYLRYVEEIHNVGVVGASRYTQLLSKARKLWRFLEINGLTGVSAREFDSSLLLEYRQFVYDEYKYVPLYPHLYPSGGGVNGSLKCSDFGNFRCSVFGSNTTVDSATMVQ